MSREGTAPKSSDPLRRLSHGLTEKILIYGRRYRPEKDWDAAACQWSGKPENFKSFIENLVGQQNYGSAATLAQFMEYRTYDWRAGPESKSLIEQYRDEEWVRLTRAEQAMLIGWLERRRCGWYELDTPDPERDVTQVHDCLTGDKFEIYDHTMAAQCARGQMFLTALLPCGDRLECSGGMSEVPRHIRRSLKASILKAFEHWKLARANLTLDNSLPRFFSEESAALHHESRRLCELPPLTVRAWLDLGMPALGGKTPRQAAADPALRGEVEALLRDFEEDALQSKVVSESVALAEIRRELGLS